MERYRGRGALSNPAPRYLDARTDGVDDGWYCEELPDSIATDVRPEPARSIISRNDSPDIPFELSINPYRGCEHGCIYCLDGDTRVLMADGTHRALAQLRPGDAIYGTERQGWYRRYVRTRVLAHWSVIKPAYRVTLDDGTTIVAGGDHRFLSERGWKYVAAAAPGQPARPVLTTANKLIGTGRFAAPVVQNEEYRRGYLCGLIRGEGLLGEYAHAQVAGGAALRHRPQLPLALRDAAALERASAYLAELEVHTRHCMVAAGSAHHRPMEVIRANAPSLVERVRELVAWPNSLHAISSSWHAGFLAGVFDAEGSYSDGMLRICNTDPQIIGWIAETLRVFGFKYCIERRERTPLRPIDVVRVLGGLAEHLRFFHSVDPAITRKRDIAGAALKSTARLGVVAIEPLQRAQRLY
ncbi:MAG TPA: LAGLIDADG family homing endonuclease, partial [Steroidobacteraceae bacterium]|nr:LAGLIDADG family homing endonuclease [Steroidobacteraceae bacterium]